MAQAIEEAAKKAEEDACNIKELTETNELLLERYQQNKQLIQKLLTWSQSQAPPPALSSSREAELNDQIQKLQEELHQEQVTR